jgi:FkbM family methyltransferase
LSDPKAPPRVASGLQLGQCRYGPMLYRTNDKFIGRSYQVYGEMNELEVRAQCALIAPGDWVLDVGANIGANTIPLAKHVGPRGRVIAFEPQRIVHQMLCANVALNGLLNVVALWSAAGAQPGTIRVPPVDYEAVENFGGIELGGEQGEAVPVTTIDQLQLERCRLIKIDVEGMELAVLQGAGDTIARLRPRLYFENNRREKSAALLGHLLALGYRLYWHFPALFNPGNYRGESRNLWPKVMSINVLGLPPGDTLAVVQARQITSPTDWWTPRQTDPSGKA